MRSHQNIFYTQVVDIGRIIKKKKLDHNGPLFTGCSLDDDNIQSDSWRHF